jgi:uncharacterized protein (DUF2235 family)
MKLVVCLDGTWNRPDDEYPTNVVKIARNLVNDYTTQMVYYDRGVGSGGKIDQLIGGATGYGIQENLEQAYRFLVENYTARSKIYILGFSRGAYTARSLGGMIYKCGLLAGDKAEKIPEVMKKYRTRTHPDDAHMVEYRDEHCVTNRVECIGVWDTVGALGVPAGFVSKKLSDWRNGFHDVKLNRLVRYAYHAVAIDEAREAFEPTLWKQSRSAPGSQVMEQVYFSGAHSDVGGGYEDSRLSDLALAWMQHKAEGAGLKFRADPPYTPAGDALGSTHDSAREWPLPKASRDIALDNDLTSFHDSVREKILGDPTYQPVNLLGGDRKALLKRLKG